MSEGPFLVFFTFFCCIVVMLVGSSMPSVIKVAKKIIKAKVLETDNITNPYLVQVQYLFWPFWVNHSESPDMAKALKIYYSLGLPPKIKKEICLGARTRYSILMENHKRTHENT